MAQTTIAVEELLYEATVNFTKVTEYGLSLTAFLAGQEAPPPSGARIDVAFEGSILGPKLKGGISGVDYLRIRADGHAQLHIHAEIATDDGQNIALFADGIASPQEGTGVLQLRENVTLTASSPAYAWVNRLLVWGRGTVDPVKGEVRVKAYAA
jgi:Protein of unknown function (DUF3237)